MNMNDNSGAATLTATIIVLLAILALSGGLYFSVLRALNAVRQAEQSAQAYLAAESGVEDMAIRLVDSGKELPSGNTATLTLNGATATTTLTGTPEEWMLTGDADASDNRRIVEVVLEDTAVGSNFVYAVQSGEGGVVMENNSEIIGTLYSNGSIQGNNMPNITDGDAWAANGSTISGIGVGGEVHGNAVINVVASDSVFAAGLADTVETGADLRADTIQDSDVAADAYYFSGISGTTVGGSEFPDTPPPSQVASASFPITDEDLDGWQAEAEEGGTWTGACPLSLGGSDTLSVGPLVIPCDVTLNNQAELTITGAVWIQGDFTMNNQSVVQLSSGYNNLDGFLVVNDPSDPTGKGIITIGNNTTVQGSGDLDSFIVLVSRNTSAISGGSTPAINIDNGTATSIFYAPEGEISITNNVFLVEATAWRLHLQNGASIEYDSGLADLRFSTNPTAGWILHRWKEIE